MRRSLSQLAVGDRIIMQGMVFHGYHGVFNAEKQLGQKFLVDIEMTTDLRKAGQSDHVRDTVDYSQVYEMIQSLFHHDMKFNLIEKVGETIASSVLNRFVQVDSVKVAVKKPHVAFPGSLQFVGIEIERKRRAGTSNGN